ncbi:hypothetical protein [Burkholderia arboris]|uniref:hypothetical protein n=1 Tax=Burkholderia arboris TaxID=488730 RepID=UPI0012D96771|nr:hypothetical protein [Burkholderia arboris]MCA8492359.1 hypothetical protein [Burkholderia arboris]
MDSSDELVLHGVTGQQARLRVEVLLLECVALAARFCLRETCLSTAELPPASEAGLAFRMGWRPWLAWVRST